MSAKAKKAAPKKKPKGYKMPVPIPAGEIINDTIGKRKWRIGPSIGVGGFGEIYSACDHESSPKKTSNYPFVIKIEPHENGPLFVEKHFYIRNANKEEIAKFMKAKKLTTFGMPLYYGSGAHDFKGEKYRFLVLERYGKDLWTIFKDSGRSFPPITVFQIGVQMLDVLEYIHSKGYVHADLKGANILLGLKKETKDQAYLVDFGLATRVNDKEFKPDPKCAHNGTIEYTSRDAHNGVPTMRGDLEILGYNMLQWLIGELPWEKSLKTPKTVQSMKEAFMKNVRTEIKQKYSNVPESLIKFFEYINSLEPKDTVDHQKCRQLFESYLKSQGAKNNKLDFSPKKKRPSKGDTATEDSADETDEIEKKAPRKRAVNGVKTKRTRKAAMSDNCENEEPSDNEVKNTKKRKSLEPAIVVKVKKAKMAPKATPPAKKNHMNIATQTSVEKKRSPRQVSFDSPICEIIGEKKTDKNKSNSSINSSKDIDKNKSNSSINSSKDIDKNKSNSSINSSKDIFEDSISPEKKTKPRRKLLSEQEVTVKRVTKKKLTTVKKGKSWKDTPAIANGRSPPK